MQEYPHIRLFVESSLHTNATIPLTEKQTHYLVHVMRQHEGNRVAVFNGSDGEWAAQLDWHGKKQLAVRVQEHLRPQYNCPDIWLLFAPLKQGHQDFLIEKATELGAARLQPVITQHTTVREVNTGRVRSICTEAAEQCERLDIPRIDTPQNLTDILGSWDSNRILLFCDESGSSEPADTVLSSCKPGTYALLTGPEGGFSGSELTLLRRLPYARGMSLGPRILRADTAAMTALACLQSRLGDWEKRPQFRAEA